MSASLYTLTGEELRLEEMLEGIIDMETGEILDEEGMIAYEELCAELGGDIKSKVEGMIQIIKNAEAKEDMFKKEIKRLQDRKKTETLKIARIKNMVHTYMTNTGMKKLECDSGVFSTRESSKVIVENSDFLPESCVKVEITRSPIKANLKKLIKSGEEIIGVHIEDGTTISFK